MRSKEDGGAALGAGGARAGQCPVFGASFSAQQGRLASGKVPTYWTIPFRNRSAVQTSTAWTHKASAAVQERAQLLEEWRRKLEATELDARAVKQQTDAKIAGIVAKLQLLAEKEAKREQQRSKSPLKGSPKRQECAERPSRSTKQFCIRTSRSHPSFNEIKFSQKQGLQTL